GDWNLPYIDYPAFGFFRVEGLEVDETYTFRVRTLNTRGSSEPCEAVTVTLQSPDDGDDDGDDGDDDGDGGDDEAPSAPGAPTGLVAAPGPGQLTLRWSAPTDDGGRPVEAYVITPHRDGSALDPESGR